MAEPAGPRVGESVTRVVNVATGFSVEVCAVTGTPIPREALATETTKRGWLLVNYARMKARGLA